MSRTTKSLLASASGVGIDPRLMVRADAEEEDKKEEREDADAGTLLRTAIADMTKCMDGLSKRMDAMEEDRERERSDKRKDASEEEEKEDAKKDASEEEEKDEKKADKRKDGDEGDKEKPEEVVADKKKDNAEDVSEEKAKADARADADIAEVRAGMRELKRQMAGLAALVPQPMDDASRDELSLVQARADSVYATFGGSAPRPLSGEDSMGYRRRVARDLRQFSPALKDVNLHGITDPTAFSAIEGQIYADAERAASDPARVPAGTLREVTRRSGGHEITEFHGEPRTWMDPMAGAAISYVEGGWGFNG